MTAQAETQRQNEGRDVGWVTSCMKWTLELLNGYFSLYGFCDKVLKSRGKKDSCRYSFSDGYICLWFLLASLVLLPLKDYLPRFVVYLALYRVLEMLVKEICVTVFHSCKITRGDYVSSPRRVITMATINYLTAGLLFGFAYGKRGLFEVSGQQSALSAFQALVQGLSIQFLQGSAFTPKSEHVRILILAQGFFCFVFVSIILSQFVSLSPLRSSEEKNADIV